MIHGTRLNETTEAVTMLTIIVATMSGLTTYTGFGCAGGAVGTDS